MNAADFDTQFQRLTTHFHLPADASRETVAVDWYHAVEHYHVDALERGITHLIRTQADRFWPPLSALLEAIRAKLAGLPQTERPAQWTDVEPFKSNGLIYGNVCVRPPESGIPAPVYEATKYRTELTYQEAAAYRQGERANQMPPGLEAKHPGRPVNQDLRKWAEQLRVTLFGHSEDVA
jgi:hypothetical protein